MRPGVDPPPGAPELDLRRRPATRAAPRQRRVEAHEALGQLGGDQIQTGEQDGLLHPVIIRATLESRQAPSLGTQLLVMGSRPRYLRSRPMKTERYATIDIGTNSVLLLVAERRASGFEAVLERAEITRLGKGVDSTRRLSPESMEATVAVVVQYVQEARSAGASAILCVATSAARDAINGHEFFAAISDRAGIAAEVIPGDEEARLSYLAAEADFGAGPKIVLDIGGGSTEVIYGSSGNILRSATATTSAPFD